MVQGRNKGREGRRLGKSKGRGGRSVGEEEGKEKGWGYGSKGWKRCKGGGRERRNDVLL